MKCYYSVLTPLPPPPHCSQLSLGAAGRGGHQKEEQRICRPHLQGGAKATWDIPDEECPPFGALPVPCDVGACLEYRAFPGMQCQAGMGLVCLCLVSESGAMVMGQM